MEIFDKNYNRYNIRTNELNNESTILKLSIANNEDILLKKGIVVPYCDMSGNSHLFVKDGVDITHFTLKDNSSVKIKESNISHLTLQDNSDIKLEDGSSISHINLHGKSKAVINGGNVGFLNLNDDAIAHIYGINISGGSYMTSNIKVTGGAVTYGTNSTIHIYANNTVFEGGKLSGLWQNGKYFSFWLIEKKPSKKYKYNEPHPYVYISSIPTQMPKQIVIHKAEKF